MFNTNQRTETVRKKQGMKTKLQKLFMKNKMTANINMVLASGLVTLMMLSVIRLDNVLSSFSSNLSVNASHVHFYSKEDEDPTNVDVDSLCQNVETHRMIEISVWKTALRNWQPFDGDVAWHAYMVTETEDPMGVRHFWSQEKQRHQLVLQHSTNKEDVVKMINGEERMGEKAWKPVPELLLRDSTALGAVPQYYVLS